MSNLIRPQHIKDTIDQSFEYCQLIKLGTNGISHYEMCQIDEKQYIKETMKTQSQFRDIIRLLDLGGGGFQMGKALARYINQQSDLPKNAKLHIFNVRAEKYDGREYVQSDRCSEYYLGEFKVENLFEAFKRKGFGDMSGKFDLIISRWCFRHLVDPVKTFASAYDLARPNTGMLLMDGFFFCYENQDVSLLGDTINQDKNMIQLLLDMKSPFIMQFNNNMRSLNQFALKRTTELPCQLPMSYLKLHRGIEGLQIASNCIVQFKREEQLADNTNWNIPRDRNYFHGDKGLFDELKPYIQNPDAKYVPLIRREGLTDDSLCEAILRGNMELFMECLDNDYWIGTPNSAGDSPLDLSIRLRDKKIFDILLSRGARCEKNSLHIAAGSDTEGYFIEKLIQSNRELIFMENPSPLDIAIQAKNLKAIEILIDHHATISDANKMALQEDKIFSEIYAAQFPEVDEKPKKPTILGKLLNWIQEGHCVVLLNGADEIMYNAPNPLQKLICININPEFQLLKEGIWEFHLAQRGYQPCPYDEEKIKGCKFAEIEQYQYAYF